jgi:hypothetical protein
LAKNRKNARLRTNPIAKNDWYRISILTCKGRLLPPVAQGGPSDWSEGENHPRSAPVFSPPKPCAITAKGSPRHIRDRNTGLVKAGHV